MDCLGRKWSWWSDFGAEPSGAAVEPVTEIIVVEGWDFAKSVGGEAETPKEFWNAGTVVLIAAGNGV
jgi:hypothetical protein